METAQVTVSRVEREISLLHELRTRLIADVVTGKLDVRAAASKLLDEPKPADDGDSDCEPVGALEEDLDSVLEEAET